MIRTFQSAGAAARPRQRVIFGVGLLVAVAGVVWVPARTIETRGQYFFTTGKGVVAALGELARAVETRDREALARLISPSYSGTDLGLTGRSIVRTAGGIREYTFAAGEPETREQLIASLLAYTEEFSSIEEVALHLERLESWSDADQVSGIARFEALATPAGQAPLGVDRARLRVTFARTEQGLKLQAASMIEGGRLIADTPAFVNVAAAAGVDFTNQYYPRFLSEPLKFGMLRYGPGGITAVDYDNDGFHDLFVPDGVESRLFRNKKDGTFEDVTQASGLGGQSGVSTAVFADYDNDGHKDAFISRTFEPNQLFHNDGDGTFTNVTAGSGIGADCCTTVASWADYDNDGDLDLYVGRYLEPRLNIPTTFYARNGEPNQLYRNDGGGKFTNVTEQAGVGDPGLCLGNVWGDYDHDGYVDLYVVNDFGRSTLYHNERNGTFTDVTVKAGALAYGAGMNASMADYDNDGLLDLYTTDIRSEHGWFAESPTVWRYMLNSWKQGVWKSDMPLYFEMFRQSGFGFVKVFQEMAAGNHLLKNRGDGTFDDVSAAANANPHGWFWGASFADFDNDGWQDVYAANGWVYNDRDTEIELEFLNNVVSKQDEYKTGKFFDPAHFGNESWHGWERNRYLRNNGDGTFTELGRPTGTDLILNSRGVAVADYWNRGALDIAVSASTDRHALLKNSGAAGHWLQVELVGTQSNRDAVGARVSVALGPARQLRHVTLGDGYGSQNSLRQHFGVGDAERVELTVEWPRSGLKQTFRNVAVNRIVQITEGRDQLVELHYSSEAP